MSRPRRTRARRLRLRLLALGGTALAAPASGKRGRSNPSPPTCRPPRPAATPISSPPSNWKTPAPPRPPRTSSSTPRPASSATPARSPSAPPADFALDQCPPNSQAGLITLHANYEGNPDYLLGTAPIFSLVPHEDETARFSFIVPMLNIPIAIPVAVRTTTDYGLRFTVQDITQLTPLAGAKMTFWGFPADRKPRRSNASPKARRATRRLPGRRRDRLHRRPRPEASIAPEPLTDNPTICTGEDLPSDPRSPDLPGPRATSPTPTATYPPITGCEKEVFKPVLQACPTTDETDSASGLELDLKSPQFLTKAAEPSEIKAATVTFPEGFTVNPDAADGQSECSEAQANFDSEGPANCPDTSKIGTFSIGTPALPERLEGLRLHRRTEARRPVPPLPDRLRLRHQRQARSARSSPTPSPAGSPPNSPTCPRRPSKTSSSTSSPANAA